MQATSTSSPCCGLEAERSRKIWITTGPILWPMNRPPAIGQVERIFIARTPCCRVPFRTSCGLPRRTFCFVSGCLAADLKGKWSCGIRFGFQDMIKHVCRWQKIECHVALLQEPTSIYTSIDLWTLNGFIIFIIFIPFLYLFSIPRLDIYMYIYIYICIIMYVLILLKLKKYNVPQCANIFLITHCQKHTPPFRLLQNGLHRGTPQNSGRGEPPLGHRLDLHEAFATSVEEADFVGGRFLL